MSTLASIGCASRIQADGYDVRQEVPKYGTKPQYIKRRYHGGQPAALVSAASNIHRCGRALRMLP
jgi:hypothetical protein